MEKKEKGALGEPYASKVRVQSYSRGPQIEGVTLTDLRRHLDDGGEFCEIARISAEGSVASFSDFVVRQMNYSSMEPGTIKAWHVHRFQSDVWFVPPSGRLLVGLLDCRERSPTANVSQRIVMGDGRAQLLRIPPGVAHGVANLTRDPQVLIYLVDMQFRGEKPDEGRLPWDFLGPEFWAATKG